MSNINKAERVVLVTGMIARDAGVKGGCTECVAMGPYGSKHAGCGGYYTNPVNPPKVKPAPEPKGEEGYCSNCLYNFNGKEGDHCDSDGGSWIAKEEIPKTRPDIHIGDEIVTRDEFTDTVEKCRSILREGRYITAKIRNGEVEIITSLDKFREWIIKASNAEKVNKKRKLGEQKKE